VKGGLKLLGGFSGNVRSCHGFVRGLSGVYQGVVSGVSGGCQWCISGLSGVCQGFVRGLSWDCQGCISGVSVVCQGFVRALSGVYIKDLSWVVMGLSHLKFLTKLHI